MLLQAGRRRPPLPSYLMARGRDFTSSVSTTIRNAFRRNRRERDRSRTSPQGQGQEQAQDQVQGRRGSPTRQPRAAGHQGRAKTAGQQAELDPTGNFRLGPHITSINVMHNHNGAGVGTSRVTVHREPLRNLPTSIPIPRVEESELSEDSSSSTITNNTQEMVSSLTSLGSRELSRLSHSDWSPAGDKHKKKRNENKPDTNRRTDDGVVTTVGVVNVAMDSSYDNMGRSSPKLHRHPTITIHRAPLPVLPENSPPNSHPLSPQLHRNPTTSTPQLQISEQNVDSVQAFYVCRAMRYTDYFEGSRYPWSSHDFGLTDQNFRPPKPYVPPIQRPKPSHHNRSPRMPLQVYQYGGYQSMDVFF